MNFSRFERNQLKRLAAEIKCNVADLQQVLENLDDYYFEYKKNKKDKDGLVRTYKDGTVKKRTISPSKGMLKKIQSLVRRNILDRHSVPDHIQGATKRRSNISNAKKHQGKKYRFTTDLLDFFPTVNNSMVYSAFLSLGHTNVQARWLTRLTTHKHGLPQGAPTSPALSNIAVLPLDKKLLGVCAKHSVTYTRFIDDLTFSSSKDFKALIPSLLNIIQSTGLKVNYRKTRYLGDETVTGIRVANNFIDAPVDIIAKAKAELLSDSRSKPYASYVRQIRQTNRQKVSKK